MSASSKTRLHNLSLEAEKLLPAYRDKWVRNRLSTTPSNRQLAEQAVSAAYREAGLAAPSFRWCASPVALERGRKREWLEAADPGPLVQHAVVDKLIGQCCATTIACVPELRRIEWNVASFREYGDFGNALRFASDEAARKLPWQRLGVIERITGRKRRNYESFDRSRWLPLNSMDVLASCDFLDRVCGFAPVHVSRPLRCLAEEVTAVIFHQHVCWLCEHPVVIKLDASHRPHSSAGPAISFADGWDIYAWKGVVLPRENIDQAGATTVADIRRERDPVRRRCRIELMTPQRFIAEGGAKQTAKDAYGILWHETGNRWDAWAAVEVTNGTAEPDGSFKKYFLTVPAHITSPGEAVAWTYGLRPDQYKSLLQRT